MICIKVIEVTNPNKTIHYELERLEKDWLGRWRYKTIRHYYESTPTIPVTFKTKEEAIAAIPLYDGTKQIKKIVYSNF